MASKRANDPPQPAIAATVGSLIETLKDLPPNTRVFFRRAFDKDFRSPPAPAVILEYTVLNNPGGSVAGVGVTAWHKIALAVEKDGSVRRD